MQRDRRTLGLLLLEAELLGFTDDVLFWKEEIRKLNEKEQSDV